MRTQGPGKRPRRFPTRRVWLPVMLALAVGVGALAWRATVPDPTGSGDGAAQPPAAGVIRARLETRPTLDPARFVGRAAQGHRVAREIPDVLDQLYCYCGCDKSAGHVSLLSCYTDGHAAT